MKQHDDIILLPRRLIPWVLVVAVVALVAHAFSRGRMLEFALILVLPLILYLVNKPGVWLIVVLGISRSSLILPGLPSTLQVVHILSLGLTILLVARTIILKPQRIGFNMSDRFLILFMIVLVLTASVRGLGLRAMGGEMWGGMGYIKLLAAAGFLLMSRHITLTIRELRTCLFMMLACSLIPVAAQLVFRLSDGAIYQQFYFVDPGQGGFSAALWSSDISMGMERYQTLKGFSEVFLLCGLAVVPWQRRFTPLLGFVVLASLAMAGLSGFRTTIITLVAALGILTVLRSRNPIQTGFAMCLVGLGCYLVAFLVIQYMPDSIQRAFSWLPGLPISPNVTSDAMNTTNWRIEVWRLAWMEVPQYLWIGKGFSISPDDILSYTARRDNILGAFLSHSYHSGPLTLLLDLGIVGLVSASGFLISSCVEMTKNRNRVPRESFISRFYHLLLAFYIAGVFVYFFIFGDVRESMSAMLLNLALLRAIVGAGKAAQLPATPAPAPRANALNQRRPLPLMADRRYPLGHS